MVCLVSLRVTFSIDTYPMKEQKQFYGGRYV